MTRVTLLIVLALSTSPVAQQRSGETISKDFVKLLLGSFGYGAEVIKEIREGAPDDFPEQLLPDGATPLVSMTTARSVTVVAEAPAFTEADVPRYERQLVAAGWARPPISNRTNMRGLVSPAAGVPAFFCSGDRFATYARSTRPGGGSLVRVAVMTAREDFSPCAERPLQSQGAPRLLDEVDLPGLIPPAESRASAMGSSSSADHEEQRMRLSTPLTAADLIEHYAAQFIQEGWTSGARAASDDIVIAKFGGKQAAGKQPVIAILTAVAVAPGDVDLTLRVLRTGPGPR